MSEAERKEALEALQLELFALDREYGDLVADFYAKRREILKRRRRLVRAGQSEILNAGEKRCRKCDKVKNVRDFYSEKRYADGRRPYCIVCDRTRQNERNEVIRKGNVIARGKAA